MIFKVSLMAGLFDGWIVLNHSNRTITQPNNQIHA